MPTLAWKAPTTARASANITAVTSSCVNAVLNCRASVARPVSRSTITRAASMRSRVRVHTSLTVRKPVSCATSTGFLERHATPTMAATEPSTVSGATPTALKPDAGEPRRP